MSNTNLLELSYKYGQWHILVGFLFFQRNMSRVIYGAPRGLGSGEKDYLFSGNWGALVIIFRDQGSKLIVLEIKRALPKSTKYI